MKNLVLFLVFGVLTILGVHGQTAKVTVEQLVGPYILGEGPHWDEENNVLYFVDIVENKILALNPTTKEVNETYIKNGPVGVAVPVADKEQTFIAGSGTDLVEVKWDPTSSNLDPEIKVLTTVDTDQNETRFNDGKVDPAGRFWAGTMGEKGDDFIPSLGSLYRFDEDGNATKVISPVSISNGLCWSHDNKTFYYIDSPTLDVVAYDYNVTTGDISNKKVVFNLKKNKIDGVPDGMTIDKDGNLWVAVWDGGRVLEINPNTGKLLRTVTIPASRVTSVAFGGPNRDILYVTTARKGLSTAELEKQPAAGYVFAVTGLGVSGVPAVAAKM